jgi:hypothetical protein
MVQQQKQQKQQEVIQSIVNKNPDIGRVLKNNPYLRQLPLSTKLKMEQYMGEFANQPKINSDFNKIKRRWIFGGKYNENNPEQQRQIIQTMENQLKYNYPWWKRFFVPTDDLFMKVGWYLNLIKEEQENFLKIEIADKEKELRRRIKENGNKYMFQMLELPELKNAMIYFYFFKNSPTQKQGDENKLYRYNFASMKGSRPGLPSHALGTIDEENTKIIWKEENDDYFILLPQGTCKRKEYRELCERSYDEILTNTFFKD